MIQRFKAEDTVDTTFGTKGKLWNPTIYNNTLLFRSLPSKSDDSINLYQFDLNGNFLKTINIGEGEDYNNDKIYLKKENNDYKIYKYDGTYLNNLLNLKDDMYFIAFNYYDYKYTIYDMNATNEATITANIYQGSVENNKPNITNESKCFTYSYNLNTNKIDVKTVACSKFDFSSSKDANILTKKWLHQ